MVHGATTFVWKTLALIYVFFSPFSLVYATECSLTSDYPSELVVATLETQTHTCYTESVSENTFRVLYPLKGYTAKTFQIIEPSAERCPDIQSEVAFNPDTTCPTYSFAEGGIYMMTLSKTNDIYSVACCNGFVEPLAFAFEPKVVPLALQIYLQPIFVQGYDLIRSLTARFSSTHAAETQ